LRSIRVNMTSSEGGRMDVEHMVGDFEQRTTSGMNRATKRYNLRSGDAAGEDTVSGVGVVTQSRQPGRADATTVRALHTADARVEDSGEDYMEARGKEGDSDHFDTRSIASVASGIGGGSQKKRSGTGRRLPVVVDGVVQRHTPSPPVVPRERRHTPTPAFENMSWAELEAYRRIHQTFQQRALAERRLRQKSPPTNDLLIREDSSDLKVAKSKARSRLEPVATMSMETTADRPGRGCMQAASAGEFFHTCIGYFVRPSCRSTFTL
jgi:hypothetical protein